jgi:hypothetical protein
VDDHIACYHTLIVWTDTKTSRYAWTTTLCAIAHSFILAVIVPIALLVLFAMLLLPFPVADDGYPRCATFDGEELYSSLKAVILRSTCALHMLQDTRNH